MKKVLLHLLCLVLLTFATRPRYASKYDIDTTNPRADSAKQYRQTTSRLFERGSRYDKARYEDKDDIDDDLLIMSDPIKDTERTQDRVRISKLTNESIRRDFENKRTDSKNGETTDLSSEWYRFKNCKCNLADETTSNVRPSERQERKTHDYEGGENNIRRKYYDLANKRNGRTEKTRSSGIRSQKNGEIKKGSRRTITFHITSRPKVKNSISDHRRAQLSRLRKIANEEKELEEPHEIDEISTRKSETRFENNHMELLDTVSGALTKLGHQVKKLSHKVVDHEKALEQHEKRLDVLESTIVQEMEKIKKRDLLRKSKYISEPNETCNPPLFDGTISFSTYIDQFEAMADENGWSKEKALTTLISALRDKALEVLDSIGDDFTYEELVDALSNKFAENIIEHSSEETGVREERFSEGEAHPEVTAESFERNTNSRSKEVNSEIEERRDEADDRSIREALDLHSKYAERPSSEIEGRNDGSEKETNSKVINVEMELLKKPV